MPFIAESPRWHLIHGDVTAAMATMRSIAKTNGKDLPDNILLTLDDCKVQENKKGIARSTIIDVIRSPVTAPRLAFSVIINFVISIVYYGLTLNVKNLGTDLHISVMLNAAAEMPAYALTALLVKRCGRRKMMVSTTWASAAFCIAAACMAATARTACAVMGVFAVTGTFNLLYIYTTELFPTTVRNAALGVVSQTGAIVVVLGRDRPFWVFGVCGAVGGLLVLLSPETVDRPLYDTMEGLERGEEGGLNGEKREKESFV